MSTNDLPPLHPHARRMKLHMAANRDLAEMEAEASRHERLAATKDGVPAKLKRARIRAGTVRAQIKETLDARAEIKAQANAVANKRVRERLAAQVAEIEGGL